MNYLVQHALNNVWCESIQDFQEFITPTLISPVGGALSHVMVGARMHPLPAHMGTSTRQFFHVYDLGQVGLDRHQLPSTIVNSWQRVDLLCDVNDQLIDLYFESGVKVPKQNSYIIQTNERNILLAVVSDPTIDFGETLKYDVDTDSFVSSPIRLGREPLKVRFYKNRRLRATDWVANTPNSSNALQFVHAKVSNVSQFTTFKNTVNAIIASYSGRGQGLWFINGTHTVAPTGWTDDYIGKTFSFEWDLTIKSIFSLPIAQIPTFTSELDFGQPKLLILAPSQGTMIDYFDDVDFYVVGVKGGVTRGYLIDKMGVDAVRQITHNAYAIKALTYNDLITKHPHLQNAALSIKVVVREGGMFRGLVHQHNRIEELYRLTYEQRLEALVGVNALVPEWSARNLEKSAYVGLMRAYGEQVSLPLVSDAYGYNTATKLMLDPLRPTTGGAVKSFTFSEGHLIPNPQGVGHRTAYAYMNGIMLGHVNDTTLLGSHIISTTYPGTDAVEVLPYITSSFSDGTLYDRDVTSLDLAHYGFRCYVSTMSFGVPQQDWVDVTDSPYCTYYPNGLVSNGNVPTVRWNWGLLSAANLFPAVRVNKHCLFVTPDLGLSSYQGYFLFTVTSDSEWFGVNQNRACGIGFGSVDVFLNGASLVEGIDYFMNWPEICVNRRIGNPTNAVIQVRCHGLANPLTAKPFKARETGFVSGGFLSVNGRYDIRNDRCIRTVVEGRLVDESLYKYGEGDSGVSAPDGKPYAISDHVLPVEFYTNQRTVPFRQRSLLVDDRVSNYLTIKLPMTVPPNPTVSGDLWAVFSPFLSGIIEAFSLGFLNAGQLNQPYDNLMVDAWITPFKYLLTYDPCVVGFDGNYVIVFPHSRPGQKLVSSQQFTFLKYLIVHYLNSRVNLTPAVAIGE